MYLKKHDGKFSILVLLFFYSIQINTSEEIEMDNKKESRKSYISSNEPMHYHPCGEDHVIHLHEINHKTIMKNCRLNLIGYFKENKIYKKIEILDDLAHFFTNYKVQFNYYVMPQNSLYKSNAKEIDKEGYWILQYDMNDPILVPEQYQSYEDLKKYLKEQYAFLNGIDADKNIIDQKPSTVAIITNGKEFTDLLLKFPIVIIAVVKKKSSRMAEIEKEFDRLAVKYDNYLIVFAKWKEKNRDVVRFYENGKVLNVYDPYKFKLLGVEYTVWENNRLLLYNNENTNRTIHHSSEHGSRGVTTIDCQTTTPYFLIFFLIITK